MRPFATIAAAIALLALPATAHSAYPGSNGKLAFTRDSQIWTMNPDGTGGVQLTTDASPSSEPEWSPDGTRILYTRGAGAQREVRVMNGDGSGDVHVPGPGPGAVYSPTWSPGGDLIAFLFGHFYYGSLRSWFLYDVYVAYPDGSGARAWFTAGADDFRATDIEWSPRGDEIAFTQRTSEPNTYVGLRRIGFTASPDRPFPGFDADTRPYSPAWSPNGEIVGVLYDTRVPTSPEIAAVDLDGAQRTQLTDNDVEEYGLEWSPDGDKIVYSGQEPGCAGDCNPELHVMNADGSGRVRLTSTTAAETDPDWQPVIDPPSRAVYPHPEAAPRLRVSLVPAYGRCTAPNMVHGAPLAFDSCSPPRHESPKLTVGTPDANGAASRMTGTASLQVIGDDPTTPADEGDVRITLEATDVRCRPGAAQYCPADANAVGGGDYLDHLRARLPLRITDLYNLPAPGGDDPGTGDLVQEFTFPCSGTPSTAVGSTCEATISLKAQFPGPSRIGAVETGRRALMELGQIEILDGSPDGTGFNQPSPFLRAGIFVP